MQKRIKYFKKTVLISIILLILIPGFSQNFSKSIYFGKFTEWELLSSKSAPEDIQVDPTNKNMLWFTQPGIQAIGSYNLKTNEIKEYRTHCEQCLPDELVVDFDGIVWFGEQSSGTLGSFNPVLKKFTHYSLPYYGANPAIPAIDKNGLVWVSDHNNDTISMFNKESKKFTLYRTISRKGWVVDILFDSKNRLWYACYEANRLGVLNEKRDTLTEYKLPISSKTGPAFIAMDSKDHIWFTIWDENKIGKFNPETQVFTEYKMNIFEQVGPSAMTIGQDDRVYFSTRGLNSIVMLDPKEDEFFHNFPIPTPESGQKDALTIDENNILWFTEIRGNKIANLKISQSNHKSNLVPGSEQVLKEGIQIQAIKREVKVKKIYKKKVKGFLAK